jgi:hypothetical protein
MDDSFRLCDPDRGMPGMRSQRCEMLGQYWNRLRGDRAAPRPDEIDPVEIKSILPHIMMVGISYTPFRALYRLVGTEIVRFAKRDFTGCYLDSLAFPDHPKDGTLFYREVAEARRPAFGVTYWIVEGTAPRWIEFLICPLSSDGATIDRCIVVEDYEHLNPLEVDSLPPVLQQ